ncbi:MAG: ABC transporter permease, partial [Bacteroidetes bacterium]|nr:ABC transporter permease [Bacteroidota bacterium]
RTKEIGIRKVLGSTMYEIMQLLALDFMKLVLLANLIAWPLAWWMMQEWLTGFAYHTKIEWWIFLAASLAVVLISLFTVITQAYRAGLTNPVLALREE